MMWSWRVAVISRDDRCSWLACLEGMVIPNPPIFAGRASRVRSRSLGGGLAVSVGMSLVCRMSSNGFKRWLMFGIVCDKKILCKNFRCLISTGIWRAYGDRTQFLQCSRLWEDWVLLQPLYTKDWPPSWTKSEHELIAWPCIYWLRCKLSFSLLRYAIMCIRSPQTVFPLHPSSSPMEYVNLALHEGHIPDS